MADQNLGVLYTPIEARTQPLEQGIKRAEVIAREGAKRIEKAAAVDLGASRTGGIARGGGATTGSGFFDTGLKMAAGIQAAGAAFSALNVAANLFSGNVQEAREALFAMPLGIGQVARAFDMLMDTIEGPLEGLTDMELAQGRLAKKAKDDLKERATERRRGLGGELGSVGLEGSDAAIAQVEAERKSRLAKLANEQREAFKQNIDLRKEFEAEREQIEEIARRKIESINEKDAQAKQKQAEEQMERDRKVAEEALRLRERQGEELTRLRDQNDVDELRRTDATAAERLQIERDTEAAIRKATAEGNTQLIPELERQKALKLAGIGTGIGGSAQQIDNIARMVLGGQGPNAAPEKNPATAKQADTQINVLRDMLSAITRLQFEATAN